MMRKCLGIIASLLLFSCSNWLDVRPRTESTLDDFFATEQGFQDALTGLYIQMKSEGLYGKSMTMTTLENIVSFWDYSPESVEEALANFNFEDAKVKSVIASIYGQAYKVIAGANSILGEIDDRREVFTKPGMYELIKGECLAIRAFCHLDILRLFGPIPSQATDANILAYAREFTKEPQLHVSFSQFKEYLLNDLTEAAKLLAESEPQWGESGEEVDAFLLNRQARMNYYAVKALQARAYLWFGDKDLAYKSAMEVIQSVSSTGNSLFRLGNRNDIESQDPADYVLRAEHIFALSDSKLEDRYTNSFGKGNIAKGSNKSDLLETLYGGGSTDIRYLLLWTEVTGEGDNKKKKKNVLRKYEETKYIPLLRLSEMYFIAIETGPVSEVQGLWEEYQIARNISLPALSEDAERRADVLMQEYRKEFIGEGQMFFRYKWQNAVSDDILWIPNGIEPVYVVPLPDTELIDNE